METSKKATRCTHPKWKKTEYFFASGPYKNKIASILIECEQCGLIKKIKP